MQGVVTFTLEELKGVPSDVVSGYTKRTEGSKEVYDITHKTPDIFPVVRTSPFPSSTYRSHYLLSSSNLRKTRKLVDLLMKVTKLD